MKKVLLFLVVAVVVIYAAVKYRPNIGALVEDSEEANQETQLTNTDESMDENFKIEDVKVGEGAEAVKGSEITVHYVGTLDDGTKFDSSRDRGTPFSFVLGSGMVIQGWEEGFEGMKVGGVRKLTIPPSMGYGDRAIGSIPPSSTLHFEVELLGVK